MPRADTLPHDLEPLPDGIGEEGVDERVECSVEGQHEHRHPREHLKERKGRP